jgi:hypothetical protein
LWVIVFEDNICAIFEIIAIDPSTGVSVVHSVCTTGYPQQDDTKEVTNNQEVTGKYHRQQMQKTKDPEK